MASRSLPIIDARPNAIRSHSRNKPIQNLKSAAFKFEAISNAAQNAML